MDVLLVRRPWRREIDMRRQMFRRAFGSNETCPKLAIVVSDVMPCGTYSRVCMLRCVRRLTFRPARNDRDLSLCNECHVLRRNGKNLRFWLFFAVSVQAS
jgi:hypothetical protein